MILFTYHKGHFDCNGRGVLHTYLVGLLVVLALIILSLCAIVFVSAQGKSVVNFQVTYLKIQAVYCIKITRHADFVWVGQLSHTVENSSVRIQVILQCRKLGRNVLTCTHMLYFLLKTAQKAELLESISHQRNDGYTSALQ